MFDNLSPRACGAIIPLQHDNDVIAMLQWYCSPASRIETITEQCFSISGLELARAVFPLQPCNDVIAVLQWYCSPVSLK